MTKFEAISYMKPSNIYLSNIIITQNEKSWLVTYSDNEYQNYNFEFWKVT